MKDDLVSNDCRVAFSLWSLRNNDDDDRKGRARPGIGGIKRSAKGGRGGVPPFSADDLLFWDDIFLASLCLSTRTTTKTGKSRDQCRLCGSTSARMTDRMASAVAVFNTDARRCVFVLERVASSRPSLLLPSPFPGPAWR